MIAYLEPAQFLGTLIIGVGVGIMLTRAYDAIQHQLRMKRIRRYVLEAALRESEGWDFGPDEHRFLTPTKTSGPEAAPANRDPQKPATDPTSGPAGVAVPVSGFKSDATGEGAPPARTSTPPWDGEWHTDWTDGRPR